MADENEKADAKENADGERGLACRRCGSNMARVIKTSRMAGYIVRRRECWHCGRRYTTSERIVRDG